MSARLDTLWSRLYKARPLWGAVGAALLGLWSGGARADVVNGAQIPDSAQKVGENRYRSHEDWKGTLKYYESVYPKAAYPRRSIANQPEVKAIHIQNPSGKNWEGLNIYETQDEVRIYVVPAGTVVKAAKKKAEGTKTKPSK